MKRITCIVMGVFVVFSSVAESMGFEVCVTNALNLKSMLTSDGFTNYMWQCVNQNTNAVQSLSARVVIGVSQLEKFDSTMDESNLWAAYQSVSNVLSSPLLTTERWQYWHVAMLNIACLNMGNNVSESYLVASNAWNDIQRTGFIDSTNIISRALTRYYNRGEDATIKESIAVMKVLAAHVVGRRNEYETIKEFLSNRMKQKLEGYLTNE